MLTKKCSDGKNYKSEILLNNFKIAFNLKKMLQTLLLSESSISDSILSKLNHKSWKRLSNP